MSWSNISIPEQFSPMKQSRERIAELEFRLERKSQECDHLYEEINNIFHALVEYKEISITSGKETIKARLVEPPEVEK